MKLNTKQKLEKAHKTEMEFEHIIEEFANAMRSAHLPYIADSEGRMTPAQKAAWDRYVIFAYKHCKEVL